MQSAPGESIIYGRYIILLLALTGAPYVMGHKTEIHLPFCLFTQPNVIVLQQSPWFATTTSMQLTERAQTQLTRLHTTCATPKHSATQCNLMQL